MKRFFHISLVLFILFALKHNGFSQDTSDKDQSTLIGLNFMYGPSLPGGDLKERFGRANDLSLGVDYITNSSFIVGFQTNYFFSKNVKEFVIGELINSTGFIVSGESLLADVLLRERGLRLQFHFGKIFSFRDNPKSGIRFTAAGAIMQHQIRIQDDTNSAPQVDGLYGEGYDRLTSGFAISEFIGYQHLSTNSRINLLIGVELTQGFTKGQRPVDFDTRIVNREPRLDLTHAFRVGITLPFYISKKSSSDLYY